VQQSRAPDAAVARLHEPPPRAERVHSPAPTHRASAEGPAPASGEASASPLGQALRQGVRDP
jgi:hypothetical protein